MPYFADLHLHSPYAYATSKSLTLDNLAAWARLKGLDLLATSDFTHPVWFGELQEKLKPVAEADGLYQFGGVKFVLGTEVSCVYRQAGLSPTHPHSSVRPQHRDRSGVDRSTGGLRET